MKYLISILLVLCLNNFVNAQNRHWSYPGSTINPALITKHLLEDHAHELKQSLEGLTIDQQQTLHDLIHIKRRTNSVYGVPYIAPNKQNLKKPNPVLPSKSNEVKIQNISEIRLLNI